MASADCPKCGGRACRLRLVIAGGAGTVCGVCGYREDERPAVPPPSTPPLTGGLELALLFGKPAWSGWDKVDPDARIAPAPEWRLPSSFFDRLFGLYRDRLYVDRGIEMAEQQQIEAAVEHVGTYLALKEQIADLEEKAAAAKAAVCVALNVTDAPPGKVWTFEGLGTVQKIRGRVTEKLDRVVLAKRGVAAELLDEATVRKEGEPSVRIEGE